MEANVLNEVKAAMSVMSVSVGILGQ